MANYLIQQGKTWSVKVPIPKDVQPVFGKKAFKKSLKTTDKSVAIARSGPLIIQYKADIANARGAPLGTLQEYLKQTKATLRTAQSDPNSIDGIQEELLERLLAAQGVRNAEELNAKAEADTVRSYKIATGQLTPFDGPLEEYVAARRVEPKTEAKDRHAIAKFASRVATVQEVDRHCVRDFVSHLSVNESLKNRTIKDNLSTLRVYWKWLVDQSLAPEDRLNPFADVTLPPENRKDAAEKVRLPFAAADIRRLHTAIMNGRSEMMKATFLIGIYTGCRLEEIASLETENVTEDTLEIVRAKTAAGNRVIPLHLDLKPLVRELKARGDRYLLPDLRTDDKGARSPAMSKQFGKVKSKLGFDHRYTFHCIRNTVATQFETTGVPLNVAADILGHKKPNMTFGLYSGGSSIEQKRKAVSKLYYGLSDSE